MSEEVLEKSTALRANLEETAVGPIEHDPKFNVIKEAVSEYQGISSQLNQLLFELHHPYRNWDLVIGELRSFSLKNLSTYSRHPDGVKVIAVLLETFLDLVYDAPRQSQKIAAADALLAYMEKLVQSLNEELLKEAAPVIAEILKGLGGVDESILSALANSFHPLARIARRLVSRLEDDDSYPELWEYLCKVLINVRRASYKYWLSMEGPVQWLRRVVKQYSIDADPKELKALEEVLGAVSRPTIKKWLNTLETLEKGNLDRDRVTRIADLPGHLDIVRMYKEISQKLTQFSCPLPSEQGHVGSAEQEVGIHLLFLFHMVEMEGLNKIHEEILRQINRNLVCYIRTADVGQLREVLPRAFELLKQQVGNFPRTSLQCIEAIGTEIFNRNNFKLVELFLELVVDFGFQPPRVRGVDSEWHVLSNPAHLQNIRVWMKLIGQKPKYCGTLLSGLIVNIGLAGTCIRDTDLFQRDVTQLLNCEIAPVYNLVKQFARFLPVYFNEIGAEGLLRDVSTELDEISHRKDRLIHFLRKQSHVESNNLIVYFIEAILCFWFSREKDCLKPYLAPQILEEIPVQGPYIDHVNHLLHHLARRLGLEPFAGNLDRLLNLSEEELHKILEEVTDVPPHERRRLELLHQMYRLENQKYKLGVQEIEAHLEEAKKYGFDHLDSVMEILGSDDAEKALDVILTELERLKDIILSPEKFEPVEEIYLKRHIAADIPSMYGRYHEKKFDALGLTFRLENLANVYFERLLLEMEVPFITRATFVHILKALKLFWRAIRLNGVNSKKFSTYLTLLETSLEVRRFSFTQYLDIVKGLSEGVKDMIYVYYLSPHQDNIARIIRQLGPEQLLPKYQVARQEAKGTADDTFMISRITERFMRELISSTFGLQYLDNFIGRVYQVLMEQKKVLDDREVDMLLSYDPGQDICSIYKPSLKTRNLIQLGNKGYNLVLLAKDGIRVPPGIIITTEVFRYYSLFQKLPGAYRNFCSQVRDGIKEIEQRTGASFGDSSNPLLLSVRSGAAISMPGMMSTIINVGSNLETTEGMAKITGNKWFAWDNYRRFVQSWSMSVGLTREIFTELMVNFKKECGVEKKREFTGEQMKELALRYRETVLSHGVQIEDDPFEQLMMSVRMVLLSWDSDKAKAYRRIMEVSDYWGTAVIVQSMSYGNLSNEAGTGVVFTANPHRKLDRVSLWGDYTLGNQGEDIVSGLVSTNPISIEQKEAMDMPDAISLEESSPEIYEELFAQAKRMIYDRKWTPQEIEFTFEGPHRDELYILQSRDMTTKKRGSVKVFIPSPELDASFLGRGIGVGGGALSGKAVFTLDEIRQMRDKEPETSLILIRSATVPDDIIEISSADGLLTAKGGQTSHAAIVAFRLDKACVVGCEQLLVLEQKGTAIIQGKKINSGDWISIDGRNGAVFLGKHPVKIEQESSLI